MIKDPDITEAVDWKGRGAKRSEMHPLRRGIGEEVQRKTTPLCPGKVRWQYVAKIYKHPTQSTRCGEIANLMLKS